MFRSIASSFADGCRHDPGLGSAGCVRRVHGRGKRAARAVPYCTHAAPARGCAKRLASTCHPAPYYTDNSLHNLEAERFYEQTLAGGMMMTHDGPIKTCPLRGIKDSPPYLHDGRCLTLEDTVEYFNLIQQLHLAPQEKKDLVAFLLCL